MLWIEYKNLIHDRNYCRAKRKWENMEIIYNECAKVLGNTHFCIAGGAVVSHLLNLEPSDVDCFFINETFYEKALSEIKCHAEIIRKRVNSVQFKLINGMIVDVVLVKKDSFKEVIECFDLVHCCHYYTPDTGIVSLDNAKLYTRHQTIHLKTVTLPYLTLGRIAMAKARGFYIDSHQERLILDYCYKAPRGSLKETEYLIG